VSTPELGEVSDAPKGTPADALELEGIDPVTGEVVRLSDYAGTPIVLNFWASWCPPCRKELPALIELAGANPGIQIVGVNVEDAAGDAKALQEEIGFDWPSIADTDRAILSQLGVLGMPTTFFLDADHRITGQIVGGADLAGFEEGLLRATGAAE
jgi:thiol-disulfide isomerase/thioredoxin